MNSHYFSKICCAPGRARTTAHLSTICYSTDYRRTCKVKFIRFFVIYGQNEENNPWCSTKRSKIITKTTDEFVGLLSHHMLVLKSILHTFGFRCQSCDTFESPSEFSYALENSSFRSFFLKAFRSTFKKETCSVLCYFLKKRKALL